MATEDYSLLDSPSHAQPHIHAPTRHHFPSSSSSSPPATSADYYPHPSFSDAAADSSGPPKSSSATNSKRAAVAGSSYYYNKKFKSSADPDPATDYRKDREEWSDTAIACLLEAYTEKFNQLNRGNLRGRDWEEVAEAVGERCGDVGGGGEGKHQKSVEQCKNKIDNLKKRYKVELQRIGSGGIATSHWHWFKKIEAIVGNSVTVKSVFDDDKEGTAAAGASSSSSMARQTKNSRHGPSNAAMENNLKTKPASNLKWRRVLFKVSGSALAGNCHNIDPKRLNWKLQFNCFLPSLGGNADC